MMHNKMVMKSKEKRKINGDKFNVIKHQTAVGKKIALKIKNKNWSNFSPQQQKNPKRKTKKINFASLNPKNCCNLTARTFFPHSLPRLELHLMS